MRRLFSGIVGITMLLSGCATSTTQENISRLDEFMVSENGYIREEV